eukprot:scaffold152627_cov27-Tisochrysis_lutea.AAC.3
MAEEEEKRLGLEESYATLQEEVEGKTKKLKKLWSKYKAAQAEIKDVQVCVSLSCRSGGASAFAYALPEWASHRPPPDHRTNSTGRRRIS